MLEKACLEKFDNNKGAVMKKAIESNAFNDENSLFFSELGWNSVLKNRLKG
jgi:hypothetical protein